jgi:hypothetical protein
MSALMRAMAAGVLAVIMAACGSMSATPALTDTGPVPSVRPASVEPSPTSGPSPDVARDPTAALVAYGVRNRESFGGLYVDPPGSRSFVMLFTRDLEMHRDAVDQIAPGTRVRQVRYTEEELAALQDSLVRSLSGEDGVEFITAATDVIGNKVLVSLKSDDPTLELRLEAAHLGMLDVSVYPVPGPWQNTAAGDGWRLLAVGTELNEAYTVHAATDRDDWDELWQAVAIPGERPSVDLDAEVIVSFGHGLSRSCPELRLDDVAIEGSLVYSVTSDPLDPRACNLDLSAAAVFVVALDRDALAADGFTLLLDERSAECCGDLDELEVALP